MPPRPPSTYFVNHFGPNWQIQGAMNFTPRHSLIPHCPNKKNLGFRQLCHIVVFSSCLTLFVLSVFQIVSIRSKPQVSGIYARTISNITSGVQEITVMQHLQSIWDPTEMQNPRSSMGFYHRPPLSPFTDLSVSLLIYGPNPDPATGRDLDSRKEPVRESFRETLIGKKCVSNVSRHISLGQSASLLRLAFLFNQDFGKQATIL